MRPISTAQHSSIVSLLNEGYSQCQIQAKTGLGKGTIGRISKEVEGNKENNPAGRPSKLSTCDKKTIIRQITTGKLDNAVQATKFINSIISDENLVNKVFNRGFNPVNYNLLFYSAVSESGGKEAACLHCSTRNIRSAEDYS